MRESYLNWTASSGEVGASSLELFYFRSCLAVWLIPTKVGGHDKAEAHVRSTFVHWALRRMHYSET